jgi:secretion/DNA translocation related TadE-like protein
MSGTAVMRRTQREKDAAHEEGHHWTLGRRVCSSRARGSVTVVMVGVIASLLILTISGLLLASAVLASHRARAAADLAGLAAAGVLMRGGPGAAACDLAAQVAAMNHGRMEDCLAFGTEVQLRVAVPAGLKGAGVATARSRAGPSPGVAP